MRKIVIPLTTAAIFLSATSSAFADSTCPTGGGFNALCFQASQLGHVVGTAITFVFVITGIIALFYLVWGGIKWLMSGGDEKAVETAQHHIVAAIIGLVIIFLSYLVVNVALQFFTNGATSLGNFTLPHL
ncbi:MAG TPA: hypothetical protein VGT05_03055 [Patescibacteria group bacterium]|nr:hypothetical protein [Patescibacteria group bacterium]